MTSFVNYLVESGISLSLFALVYFLLLRRETFFAVNRWFLLVSVTFSALLPLIHIPVYTVQTVMLPEVTVTPYVNLLSTVTVYATSLTNETETFVLSNGIFVWIYLAGLLFFMVRLLFQIFQVVRLIVRHQVIAENGIKLVLLEKDASPFSFLNYVFVGQGFRNKPGWENMLEHERQHILQRHTYDVLILELVAVFQWFNPFFWLFRRALRENHEFLADRAVLARGAKPAGYKQTLVNQYVGDQIVLTNNFNYSLIKIRIKMMSKIKSRKIALAKIALGVLMAAALIVSFGFQQNGTVNFEATQEGKENIAFDGKTLAASDGNTATEKAKNRQSKSEGVGTGSSNKEVIVTADTQSETKSTASKRASVKKYTKYARSWKKGGKIYESCEQMPQFEGGQESLMRFVMKGVRYPVSAMEAGIQGRVFVSFIVEKDGSIKFVKVSKSVDPALDAEAIRVIQSMPNWIPGKQDGKPVRVAFTMPINFVLN